MVPKPDRRRARSAPTAATADRPVHSGRAETWARVAVLVAVAVAIGVGLFLVGIRGSDSPTGAAEDATVVADLAQFSGRGGTSPPPWPALPDASGRAEAAGLSLGPLGMAEHYHVHLDDTAGRAPADHRRLRSKR